MIYLVNTDIGSHYVDDVSDFNISSINEFILFLEAN